MDAAMLSPRRIVARLGEGLDGTLVAITALLVALGLATLYSASAETPARLNAQLANLAVAVTAMWIMAQVAPQTLMRFAVPAYILGIALLVAVALFGDIVNGARRWLHVGVTRFQPSEVMKLALPLMLAWYFHRNESMLRLRDFAVAAVLGVIGLAALFPLWGMLHDYQRRRILTLLDPSQDPLGAGYHTIQSTIAVGSGGITGKGWLGGTQTHLEFIPERHTDFIFAVFSEEFGLIGNLVLLALYIALIARGLMIAANAPTFFARLLAASMTLMFFTYAFVNMGMVSGILPVVGVPLPFISYGGTAMVTLFIGIGILLSVQRHRKLVQT